MHPVPPPDSTTPVAGGDGMLERGAAIGRFVVLGLLGKGGMGEVYAAHDPELDRKVAIKLLRAGSESESPDGRLRLMREAQAIARVSHPNVVVVYDVGTLGKRVFIAMELIEGSTLRYWMHAKDAQLARNPGGLRGGGTRSVCGARAGAGPPRLQARQRHDRRRRSGAGHGLRPRAARRRTGPAENRGSASGRARTNRTGGGRPRGSLRDRAPSAP